MRVLATGTIQPKAIDEITLRADRVAAKEGAKERAAGESQERGLV